MAEQLEKPIIILQKIKKTCLSTVYNQYYCVIYVKYCKEDENIRLNTL